MCNEQELGISTHRELGISKDSLFNQSLNSNTSSKYLYHDILGQTKFLSPLPTSLRHSPQ
jgi:hypothetical protein